MRNCGRLQALPRCRRHVRSLRPGDPRRLDHLAQPHDLAAHELRSSSGGGLSTAMRPVSSNSFLISGSARIAFSSRCSRSTIGFGVPAGATIICQDAKSNPGTPASAMVGMLGHRAKPLGRRNAERAHLAGVHQRQHRRRLRELRRDVTGDQIVERRRIAAIGHVHDVGAGHGLEQLHAEVLRRARTGRAVRRRLRLRL